MIVVDTNILISALIKDSITRRIIVNSNFNFAYPEISLQEIMRHKDYIIRKGEYKSEDFYIILNKLLEYITLIPLEVIISKLKEADKIMSKIDVNDTIFIAAALALNADIWSEDKDFDRQKNIKVLKTSDMIQKVNK